MADASENRRELWRGEKSWVREPHAPPCTYHTVPCSQNLLKKLSGSLFLMRSNPCLTSLRTGAPCCTPSCLTFLPSWPPWCPGILYIHAHFCLPASPPCRPAEPGLAFMSSVSAHWLPDVPESDKPIPSPQGWVLLTLLCSIFTFQGPLTCPALPS